MRRPRSAPRLAARVVRLLSFSALGVLLLADAGPADARINPYHVIRSGVAEASEHRIMVLVDTSPSMSAPADGSADVCVFGECEDDTSSAMSKLQAAKSAMLQVIDATDGLAEYAFVGFTREELGNNHPGDCSGDSFQWVTSYESLANSGGATSTIDLHGYPGMWRLCGNHEGFPYLRFDNTRFNNPLPDDLTTAVTSPAAPTDQVTFSDEWHETRKVQWFGEFKGVRFQPDATDYADSQGDYTSTEAVGETFYYWPYVDGFPGYSDFQADGELMGVNGEQAQQSNPLEFYGPLYIDPTQYTLNPNYDGPASATEARADLIASLQTMQNGGIDLANDAGFQWDNLIGPSSAPAENAQSIFSSTNLQRNVRWTIDRLEQVEDACGGFSVIIISDGINGWGNGPANETAYERLSELHEDYGVDSYVIGFNSTISDELNKLACAGGGGCENAGASCSDPCTETSNYDFDTCQDSDNPTTACAWSAEDPSELATQFAAIVAQILDVDVDSGQGAVVNSFGVAGTDDFAQTLLRAYTEAGTWKGHVQRGYCTDVDSNGVLQPYCEPPNPEFELPDEAIDLSFGGCTEQTRVWDAGQCLQNHAPGDRRLYTHSEDHTLVPVQDNNGDATAAFRTELTNLGILTPGNEAAEADAIAQFVSGVNAPGGWKLAGLANSSPVVVKRIPEYDSASQPEVAIRDPHCGGRFYNSLQAGALPDSLENLAKDAWDPDLLINNDYEYQEAVLVGDDMGVLHAFQLDSGNELWGFIPRGVLANLAAQAANGPENMGQSIDTNEHIFGVESTVNHGWIHDPGADGVDNTGDDSFRHVAVFGIGAGGSEYANLSTPAPNLGAEYYVIDITHMHPDSPKEPLEILWSTEDTTPTHALDLKTDYDNYLGQTWARPAITYEVPNDQITNPPDAYIVMGSGYQVDGSKTAQGRVLIKANALTGEIVETATLPAVTHAVYESDFGTVVDAAVGSHCISRFWAESQETYIADPAGRVFRWDLGRDTSHESDSGGVWSTNGDIASTIDATTPYFPACTGTGATCTVGSTGTGDVGDVFVYPAAVTANDRIDDFTAIANGDNPGGEDQFLVALVSGSPYETTIDGYETGLDFHSSLYILVDDHTGDKNAGFTIPADAPKTAIGGLGAGTSVSAAADDAYFRVALTDIERTRIITIDGEEVLNETANFKRETRPIRAPRIVVTGAADDSSGDPQAIEDVEVYYVEFTVYEPPDTGCNTDFVDTNGVQYDDLGSTYILRFRLTADSTSGFNLTNGSGNNSVDFGAGFDRGLVLTDVEQLDTELSDPGNQGPKSSFSAGSPPCDDQGAAPGGFAHTGFAIPLRTSEISGFSPIE